MTRTTAAILVELDKLAGDFPWLCTVHDYSLRSRARPHPLRYLRITSPRPGPRQAVLLTGGLHAREWAPPNALSSALLGCARRLLHTYSTPGTVLEQRAARGSESMRGATPDAVESPAHIMTHADVERALDRLEIYIAPLIDSDGRDCTMARLSGPVLEETQLVTWLVENKNVRFFMDIHGDANSISYLWAMDERGTDPDQGFDDPAWDLQPTAGSQPHRPRASSWPGRDDTASDVHGEYVPNDQVYHRHDLHVAVARSMRDDTLAAAGSGPEASSRTTYQDRIDTGLAEGSIAEIQYTAPASGMDWVLSRQRTSPELALVHACAAETGCPDRGEMPPIHVTQHARIEREVTLAVMGLLRLAAGWTPTTDERPGKSRWYPCFLATAVYGNPAHPPIAYIRTRRDREPRSTALGRRYLRVAEGVYHCISALIARFSEHRAAERALARPSCSREQRVPAKVAMLTALALLGLFGPALALWLLVVLAVTGLG